MCWVLLQHPTTTATTHTHTQRHTQENKNVQAVSANITKSISGAF